jgi:tetratricopeptide (TPR) repeat protein
MNRIVTLTLVVVFSAICFSGYARKKRQSAADRIPRDEYKLDTKIFAKLDTFESVTLEEADKTFMRGDFVGALAAYKSFTFEFTKSKALPYALFRMGRCLHLVDKRNAAVKAYQNVVDYFPDDVRFASAAMYMQGDCHTQNGEDDKCVAVWAKMVQDRDYVTQPKSGTALEFLAKEMDKRKKSKEAMEYRWRTAVNFRKKNPRAADAAGHGVVNYYMQKRNLAKLKEFCIAGTGTGYTNIAYGGRVREMPGGSAGQIHRSGNYCQSGSASWPRSTPLCSTPS